MTLLTGNNIPRRLYSRCGGFTFIEIMMTLALLGGGIVMLYKTFFLCVDYQNHLTYRFHALNLLEHKIAITEQMLRDYKILSFEHDIQKEEIVLNGRPVAFKVDVHVVESPEIPSLYQAKVIVSWREGQREVTLKRFAYLSSISSIQTF